MCPTTGQIEFTRPPRQKPLAGFCESYNHQAKNEKSPEQRYREATSIKPSSQDRHRHLSGTQIHPATARDLAQPGGGGLAPPATPPRPARHPRALRRRRPHLVRLEEAATGAPQHPNPLRRRHCDGRRRRACAALPCPPWLRPLQAFGTLWPEESVRLALRPTRASPLMRSWATGKLSVSWLSAGTPGHLRTRAVSLLLSRALFGLCVSQVTGCLSQPEAVPASI